MNFKPTILKVIIAIILGSIGGLILARYLVIYLAGPTHNPFWLFGTQAITVVIVYIFWSIFQVKVRLTIK